MVLRLPFLVELEIGNVGLWSRGEYRTAGRKTSWGKGESQQQTEPTYDVNAGI